MIIPKGTPRTLPMENLLNSLKSTSLFICQISEIEMTSERIILIWIASCDWKIKSKNGVAIIEKPNPVLVCKIDATKMIKMKSMIVSK